MMYLFTFAIKSKKMKKIFLAVAVVAFFASCKKDYTCTCTYGGNTSVTTYSSVSGANANFLKASCESSSTSGSVTLAGCVWDKK